MAQADGVMDTTRHQIHIPFQNTELLDNHRRKLHGNFYIYIFLLLLFRRCQTFMPGGWWKGPKKCNNQDSLTLHGWNFCAITKVSNLFDLLRGGKSDSWKKIQDLVRGDARAGLVMHWFERGSWKVWVGNYTSCCLKINDETSNEWLKYADSMQIRWSGVHTLSKGYTFPQLRNYLHFLITTLLSVTSGRV